MTWSKLTSLCKVLINIKSNKYVIIVLGEPFSTFTEIIGKYFKKVKILKKKNSSSWKLQFSCKSIKILRLLNKIE